MAKKGNRVQIIIYKKQKKLSGSFGIEKIQSDSEESNSS